MRDDPLDGPLGAHSRCWSDDSFMRTMAQHIMPHLRKPSQASSSLVYRANVPIANVTYTTRNYPEMTKIPTVSRQSLHHPWIYCRDGVRIYSEYVGNLRYEDASETIQKEIALQFTLAGIEAGPGYAVYVRRMSPVYLKYEKADMTYMLVADHVGVLVPDNVQTDVPVSQV